MASDQVKTGTLGNDVLYDILWFHVFLLSIFRKEKRNTNFLLCTFLLFELLEQDGRFWTYKKEKKSYSWRRNL